MNVLLVYLKIMMKTKIQKDNEKDCHKILKMRGPWREMRFSRRFSCLSSYQILKILVEPMLWCRVVYPNFPWNNPIPRKIRVGQEILSYFLCIKKVNNFVPKPPIFNILCHKACSVLWHEIVQSRYFGSFLIHNSCTKWSPIF